MGAGVVLVVRVLLQEGAEMRIGAITHVEEIDETDPANADAIMDVDFFFKRINAAEATHTVLEVEHYRELIRLAADGRVSDVAYFELRKILHELFALCPEAGDAYVRAVQKIAKEAKKNAEV